MDAVSSMNYEIDNIYHVCLLCVFVEQVRLLVLAITMPTHAST